MNQVGTSLITTWSLTKLSMSLCGSLEDVDNEIRLHIVMRYIIAKGHCDNPTIYVC